MVGAMAGAGVGEVGVTTEEDGAAGASARLRTGFMVGQRRKAEMKSGKRGGLEEERRGGDGTAGLERGSEAHS